jgi:hypothetical protein
MIGRLIKKLTPLQVKAKIYAVRAKEFANIDGIITMPPMSLCGGSDERNFLRFSLNFFANECNQKLYGWGHPDLIFLCRGVSVNLFVDCTFKMVPVGKFKLGFITICLLINKFINILYIKFN